MIRLNGGNIVKLYYEMIFSRVDEVVYGEKRMRREVIASFILLVGICLLLCVTPVAAVKQTAPEEQTGWVVVEGRVAAKTLVVTTSSSWWNVRIAVSNVVYNQNNYKIGRSILVRYWGGNPKIAVGDRVEASGISADNGYSINCIPKLYRSAFLKKI
jgi:hypothetical protein